MTNFRNRFLILIFEKRKKSSNHSACTSIIQIKTNFQIRSSFEDFLTLVVQPTMYKWHVKKTCSRKAALYKHLYFGPLVLIFWLIYTWCRWCRWVVIYTKAEYKIQAKINPSPIWDESVFRFKSFFVLHLNHFVVVDGFWVSFFAFIVSVFSFFVWRSECFILLAPPT